MTPLWTPQGREYRPTPAELTPGWTLTPVIERGLWENDPGVTRVIGAIERPLLLSSGEQISLVALVATGDPDGREYREWIPITARIVRDGEARLAREAAPKKTKPAKMSAHEMALPSLRAGADWDRQALQMAVAEGHPESILKDFRLRAEQSALWVTSPEEWAKAHAPAEICYGESPWGKDQE